MRVQLKKSSWGKEVGLVYSTDDRIWIAVSETDEWLGSGKTPLEALTEAGEYFEATNQESQDG